MTLWLLAVAVGVIVAALLYGVREQRLGLALVGPALLRAAALTLVVALLVDAPVAPRRAARPLVALDASESWRRAAGSALWREAVRHADAVGADTLLLFGDSVRAANAAPELPSDRSSVVRAAVERARAAGRPLVVVTDGVLDDPESLRDLPAGSRVDVVAPGAPARDLALRTIDVPRAIVAGDTAELRASLLAGPAGSAGAAVTLLADGRPVARGTTGPFAAGEERQLALRFRLDAPDTIVLAAVAAAPGDAEPRNDSLAVAVEVSRAAGAVVVSTSPDYDVRYAVGVLRGASALPTRAFFRVAPRLWRADGTLAPVGEDEVRAALRDAPLALLHGDTAYFGAPRAATRASLVLVTPAAASADDTTGGEWYPVGAPPSPLAPFLAGVAWDSLPPLALPGDAPVGEWVGLEAARDRRGARRSVVAGSAAGGRRVVSVGASGLWRWAFRGGASAGAFQALWGSIFDWLSAERPDARAALPADGVVRAGEPIRWRRGGRADSLVTATLRRRGAARADTVALRFPAGESMAESAPLAPGVYDVAVRGGRTLLAVNASREWLPRAPSVRSGAVGGAAPAGAAPGARSRWWLYALAVALLSAEWLLRRRLGLR